MPIDLSLRIHKDKEQSVENNLDKNNLFCTQYI